MRRLEDELKSALRRREPSPDFTARVLAAAGGQRMKRNWWAGFLESMRPSRPGWAAAAAIACLLLVFVGTTEMRKARERARGEAAKAQVMQALEIAGDKLNRVQERLDQLSAINEVRKAHLGEQ